MPLSPYLAGGGLVLALSAVSLMCAWISMRRRARADRAWEQANPDLVLPPHTWKYRKIWMSRGQEANRRYFYRAGPAVAIYFGVFALIGAWLTAALIFLTLAPPAEDAAATGEVVQVHSCEESLLWAMGAYKCHIDVDWDDPEVQPDATVSLHSVDSFDDSTEAMVASNGTWVVPVERFDAPPAYWAIAPILGLGAWGIVLGSLHYPQHSHIRRVRDWPTH